MTISITPTLLNVPLMSVFDAGAPNGTPLSYAMLCYGDFPASPTDSTNSPAKTMSGSGTTIAPTSIPLGSWSMPSKGVTMILGGVGLSVATTAAVNGKVPTFIRIGSGSSATNIAGIDASVSNVKGPDNFRIDRLDPSTGSPYALKDARIKIKTRGAFSVNNTIANAILSALAGSTPSSVGYNGALLLGYPYVFKPDGNTQAAPILLEAFTGSVPASANDEATGTKLWSKSISSTTGLNIFAISNNAISLQGDTSAVILADGTPTYIRVTKAAATASLAGYTTMSYPKGVIQAPVGDGSDQVTFDKTNFVTGQTATLNSFTMLFYPNLS